MAIPVNAYDNLNNSFSLDRGLDINDAFVLKTIHQLVRILIPAVIKGKSDRKPRGDSYETLDIPFCGHSVRGNGNSFHEAQ
jgi:hypothetical protein